MGETSANVEATSEDVRDKSELSEGFRKTAWFSKWDAVLDQRADQIG